MKKHLLFIALLALVFSVSRAQTSPQRLTVGDAVPKFSLLDQNGKTFNIADHIGKQLLVIYFYPKDESMVCTKEACAFRDSFDDFTKAGAAVIGINGGTVASHKAFADKYKLQFTLLSDPGNKVYTQFGVKGKLFLSGRQTFIIDKTGKVVYQYDSMMEGKQHAIDALAYVRSQVKK
ncbi:peroxiredoxin [Mucilaginibacter antarcticus]|uniref:thioredoxin-dependent peroxiredoxin n=1 Tax=Mucilaginibacter antarcticus TaxID=1855725 RepID=A0ABW5XLI7_9SPHI